MRTCLETGPERLLEMGRAANQRVRQRHDADVEAAKLKALFEATRAGVALHGGLPAASAPTSSRPTDCPVVPPPHEAGAALSHGKMPDSTAQRLAPSVGPGKIESH
jgi:hypothetical protein